MKDVRSSSSGQQRLAMVGIRRLALVRAVRGGGSSASFQPNRPVELALIAHAMVGVRIYRLYGFISPL